MSCAKGLPNICPLGRDLYVCKSVCVLQGEVIGRGGLDYLSLIQEGGEGEGGPGRKRLQKTDEGLYACDICDKTFQKSSSLLRHKYEHTGKYRVYCNYLTQCILKHVIDIDRSCFCCVAKVSRVFHDQADMIQTRTRN